MITAGLKLIIFNIYRMNTCMHYEYVSSSSGQNLTDTLLILVGWDNVNLMQKENASWSLDYVLEKESPTWARSRWRCAASDCWLSRVMWPDSCTTHSSGSASSTPWCQTEKCTFPGIGNENRIIFCQDSHKRPNLH